MGGAPKQSSSSTTEHKMGPEQQRLFALAEPHLQEYAGRDLKIHEGTGVADLSPFTQQGIGYATQAAAPLAANMGLNAANAQGVLTNPDFLLDPDSNKYLGQAASNISRRGGEEFLEQIAPELRKQGQVAGGVYSGGNTGVDRGMGLAAAKQGRAVTDAVAKMYSDAYGQGLGALTQGTAMTPELMKSQAIPAQLFAQAGQVEQDQAQKILNEAITKFYAEQNLPLEQGLNLMSALGMTPGGTTTSTGSVGGGGMSGMQGLGAGMSLLSSLGGGAFGMK